MLSSTRNAAGGLAVFACLLSWSGPAVAVEPVQSSTTESCTAKAAAPGVAVNVRDKGAKGNGRDNDTAAIQAAIDAVGGTNGTVLIPKGIYMVETVKHRLMLKSNMTLKLAPGAILRAIPNAAERYFVLSIKNATNVTVTGGTLDGDRKTHKGTTGEWGMGLYIGPRSMNIRVNNVQSNNMWGDGFYVQGARGVSLCRVSADANRRQGLSIVEVHNMIVENSVFKNTHGTRPSAGIDLEPDNSTNRITDVHIRNSKFIDNEGGGVLVAGRMGQIARVEITNNTITGPNPIDISHAPGVQDSTICRNRHIFYEKDASGGLSPFEEPVRGVIMQEDCGDRRMMVRKHN